jgi:glycosyltransferase involved in cell wall biosynthesis
MADFELSSRLSEAARRRVLERFTWQACAAATADSYRWIIEHHRANRSPSLPPC